MLSVQGVTYTYQGAASPALDDVSIKLEPGQVVGIHGDNASGKTSLSLVLCGAIPDLLGGSLVGTLLCDGETITPKELQQRSAYVFQDPQHYFIGNTVREEFALCPDNTKILHDLAAGFMGITDGEQPLCQLSGGQQQLIAVVSALTRKSELVILDEPFAFLDDDAAGLVRWHIKEAKEQGKTIVVMSSAIPDGVSLDLDREYFLVAGRLNDYVSRVIKREEVPQISEAHVFGAEVVLETRNISYAYPGTRRLVLSGVDFQVHRGESLCIDGKNGTGKTTLLMYLAGLLRRSLLDAGKQLFRGPTDVVVSGQALGPKTLRHFVKCAFQNPDAQIFASSVTEEMAYGLRRMHIPEGEITRRVNGLAQLLPFCLDADPFQLSFGQRKLVTIAATFVMESPIMVLDEPLAGLDEHSRSVVRIIATMYLEQGGCLIVAAHDVFTPNFLCHRSFPLNATLGR